VDLKAVEPTWVAVYVDGRQTLSKLLDTDQSTTIDNARQIRVRLGNAGGVEISANGKPIGPVGNRGEVRVVEFTANGFRIIPLAKPPGRVDGSRPL
jgi:cytoskeleton protein RodZ